MNVQQRLAVWNRVLWLITAFLLFGVGVGCIWWPASRRIEERQRHARDLYDQANSLDDATTRAAALREAQSRVKKDLRELGGARSNETVTAALLRLVHDGAHEDRVEIRELSPDTSNTEKAQANNEQALTSYAVTVRLRGSYRNIIRFVADLPRHDVLVDIRSVEIAAANSGGVAPLLDVTIHSAIYRVIPSTAEGAIDVRTL